MPADFSQIHERQDREAMDFIADRAKRCLPPPTIRELADHLGMTYSTSAVRVIERLERDGKIERAGGHRTIRLLSPPKWRAGGELPLRNRASCGPGVEAEDTDDRLDLAALFGRDDLAAFTAVGKSMTEAGIQPGDILIVRECPDPENGQTVVAMVDRAMLCKRFYRLRNGGVIHLRSCSPDVPTVEVDPRHGHFRVLGVLHSLIRKF